MNGLTNIITKIKEQSDAQCLAITASAKEKADLILENARLEAEKYLSKQREFLKAKETSEKAKAESAAEFEYKRVILAGKCEIIDTCMKQVLETMCKASDEEYFGYIKKLAAKYALDGEGNISFNEKDIARLPEDFEKELCAVLGQGKTLKISGETINTDGGFVISYPEMRVDCTFSSLIEENADSIKDAINKMLFS